MLLKNFIKLIIGLHILGFKSTIKITIDNAISTAFDNPIITLNGMQNGAEIGNKAANKLSSLVGFIIVKYAK